MNKSSEEKIRVGDVFLIALIPLAIAGLYFYWMVGWAIDDGMYYPVAAKIGLILFSVLGFVLLGLWLLTNKFHKSIKIASIVVSIGIVSSISFVKVAEAFPEQFDLYKGERFFTSVTLQELEDITKGNATGIYYIGNEDCPKCSEFHAFFSTLVGKNKVIIRHYDPTFNNEKMSDEVRSVMQIYNVSSFPTVLVVKGGTVTQIFDGNNIKEQVQEFFDKLN